MTFVIGDRVVCAYGIEGVVVSVDFVNRHVHVKYDGRDDICKVAEVNLQLLKEDE